MHKTPAITLSTASLADESAELFFVPVFEQDGDPDAQALDAATSGEFGRARERGEFRGKPFELFTWPVSTGSWKARRIAAIGVGPAGLYDAQRARRFATVAGLFARERKVGRIALLCRHANGAGPERVAQAMAEGVCLASYDGGSYKTSEPSRFWIESAAIVAPNGSQALASAVERGRVLGDYTNVARGLSNEPGNALTPSTFADRAVEIGRAAGLTVETLDEKQIEKLGMGLLLGVARGSQEPPRVIVLKHQPAGAPASPVLGLVGKGITFDTGGISIKPADNMDKMKDDMSGGAAVIAAMSALSRLKVPLRIVGVVPAAENMPGGRATKPGDILKSANGKTVEVINTDAEGRLVLGDGLWYAQQLGATHLVDVATLTGACIVALGKTTSGLFGTPDPWLEQVREASDRAGDRAWPMPLFEDYREQLRSEIADMTNTGGRPAGAITAALFIKEFVGVTPWVHMDIAGTAWAEEAKPYQPKGATGVSVRTLAELALAVDSWRNLK